MCVCAYMCLNVWHKSWYTNIHMNIYTHTYTANKINVSKWKKKQIKENFMFAVNRKVFYFQLLLKHCGSKNVFDAGNESLYKQRRCVNALIEINCTVNLCYYSHIFTI